MLVLLHLLVLQCPRSLTKFSGHRLQLGGDTFPLRIGRGRKIRKLVKTHSVSESVNFKVRQKFGTIIFSWGQELRDVMKKDGGSVGMYNTSECLNIVPTVSSILEQRVNDF